LWKTMWTYIDTLPSFFSPVLARFLWVCLYWPSILYSQIYNVHAGRWRRAT
jgi:hypothetical protein